MFVFIQRIPYNLDIFLLTKKHRMPFQLTCQFPDTKTHFTVQLMKTIRVRNDGKTHGLPPSLGHFSFFMHEGKRIVPIGNEEALWFSFAGNPDVVAVKFLAGGINAITGEKETGEARTVLKNNGADAFGQNYMIIPDQPWLDGFKKQKGTVGQFIAVPLGKGRSVEEKLEKTQTGSIQMIVIPVKKEILEQQAEAQRLRRAEIEAQIKDVVGIMRNNIEKVLERDSALGDLEDKSETVHRFDKKSCKLGAKPAKNVTRMGLGAGGSIAQEIITSNHAIDDFDVAQAQYIELSLVDAKQWSQLTKLPAPPRVPTEKEYTDAGGLWFDYVSGQPTVDDDPASRLLALDKKNKLTALSPENPEHAVPDSQVVHLGLLKPKEHSSKHGFFARLRHCCPCLSPKHEDAEEEMLDTSLSYIALKHLAMPPLSSQ